MIFRLMQLLVVWQWNLSSTVGDSDNNIHWSLQNRIQQFLNNYCTDNTLYKQGLTNGLHRLSNDLVTGKPAAQWMKNLGFQMINEQLCSSHPVATGFFFSLSFAWLLVVLWIRFSIHQWKLTDWSRTWKEHHKLCRFTHAS